MKYSVYIRTKHDGGLHASDNYETDKEAIYGLLAQTPVVEWFGIYREPKGEPSTLIYQFPKDNVR